MHRIAASLVALTLGLGVAACGDDDEETASTTSTPTTTEARGYTTAGDEPFEVQATIEKIRRVEGSGESDAPDQDPGFTVITAETEDGKTYEVLVPADLSLDEQTAQVFSTPDCAGKVLANLELVNAPAHETEGDTVLVTASIDTENCLTG